jgi:hypothetical protein
VGMPIPKSHTPQAVFRSDPLQTWPIAALKFAVLMARDLVIEQARKGQFTLRPSRWVGEIELCNHYGKTCATERERSRRNLALR